MLSFGFRLTILVEHSRFINSELITSVLPLGSLRLGDIFHQCNGLLELSTLKTTSTFNCGMTSKLCTVHDCMRLSDNCFYCIVVKMVISYAFNNIYFPNRH